MTEKGEFPGGLPLAQFDDRGDALVTLAALFPLATSADHPRASRHGRRLAWHGRAPSIAVHLARATVAARRIAHYRQETT